MAKQINKETQSPEEIILSLLGEIKPISIPNQSKKAEGQSRKIPLFSVGLEWIPNLLDKENTFQLNLLRQRAGEILVYNTNNLIQYKERGQIKVIQLLGKDGSKTYHTFIIPSQKITLPLFHGINYKPKDKQQYYTGLFTQEMEGGKAFRVAIYHNGGRAKHNPPRLGYLYGLYFGQENILTGIREGESGFIYKGKDYTSLGEIIGGEITEINYTPKEKE